jgi:hypothetical protein
MLRIKQPAFAYEEQSLALANDNNLLNMWRHVADLESALQLFDFCERHLNLSNVDWNAVRILGKW